MCRIDGWAMRLTAVVGGRVPGQVDVVAADARHARRVRRGGRAAARAHAEPRRAGGRLAQPRRVLGAHAELVLVRRLQVISLGYIPSRYLPYF